MFNPPHSSHFAGVRERQIGTIRRVLDAILLELGKHQLTNELLITLLAEVSAIVNAQPITAISSDPDDPCPKTCICVDNGEEANIKLINSGYTGGKNTYKICRFGQNGISVNGILRLVILF